MKDLLQSICDKAIKRGASFADVRVLESEHTSVMRQDGRADKLNRSTGRGIGIRVLKDAAWGFASAADFDNDTAMRALDTAVAMAEASSERSYPAEVAQIEPVRDTVRCSVEIDPRSVSVDRKMAALESYEHAAMGVAGDRMANSIINYSDGVRREIICNTFGTLLDMESITTFLSAFIVVSDGSIRQKGRARAGAPVGYELVENTSAEDLSVKAATQAVSLLSADLPPAGKMPVVFHPSVTGLFAHESIGHNAEADHVLTGSSIIAGKEGQKIASDLVTIIDDATIPGKWGSYQYDSEGTPGARRVLIENGVLKNYMHTLETASKMGVIPTGSGRADGYENRPIVRMSNTFIQPGDTSFDDMIKDIDQGVYLKGGEYGYVLCERGQFTCHAGEAQLIKNGQLAQPLRDVSVAGMTLEALANIDAVSDDFEMKMPGFCGKDGQSMFVDNGGPHIRVKELVVGGQS